MNKQLGVESSCSNKVLQILAQFLRRGPFLDLGATDWRKVEILRRKDPAAPQKAYMTMTAPVLPQRGTHSNLPYPQETCPKTLRGCIQCGYT